MRFYRLIIIGILLIVAGAVLLYHDQSESKTRACKRRIRKAQTAVCTWTVIGETRTWNLSFAQDEELFKELQEAMLADLNSPREDRVTASIPEYRICVRDKERRHTFDFDINMGRTSWIECGGGIYPNKGYTQEFLRDHKKQFQVLQEEPDP